MEQQLPTIILICVGFLLADFYLIGGIRIGLKKWKFSQKAGIYRLVLGIIPYIYSRDIPEHFSSIGPWRRVRFLCLDFS